MNSEQKYKLITTNLQEVTGGEIMKKILDKRDLKIYWGTATTGKPHIAYFLPLYKLKDFVDSGCHVKILLADVHAFLDNLKAPMEKIEQRSVYYKTIISAMLTNLDVDLSKIEFVLGSNYQNNPAYFDDVMRILSLTNQNDAKRSGTEVVKQVSDCKLSSLVYPVMQALDEEYLMVDAQFGGVDQRKIFMYASEFLPMMKYKKRIHLMTPMIPGLNSDKMSSSDKDSKIDLLDSYEDIKSKINGCSVDSNGLLYLYKYIIFPYCMIKHIDVIISGTKYDCNTFEKVYLAKTIEENALKSCATDMINKLVDPVRSAMLREPEIIANAYE